MVAFTYVFVNQLPGEGGATTESTVDDTAAGPTSSTSIPDGSDPGTSQTTAPSNGGSAPQDASPEVTAYRQAMAALATELTALQADLASANSAWEEGGDFSTAEQAFTSVSQSVAAWRDQVAAVSVPEGMADTQSTLVEAANQAANQAAAALDGLVNSPGPDKRVNSVTRFDEAVSAFTETVGSIG